MKGVIEYVDDEVVSGDFVGDPCTSIFDSREGIQLNGVINDNTTINPVKKPSPINIPDDL